MLWSERAAQQKTGEIFCFVRHEKHRNGEYYVLTIRYKSYCTHTHTHTVNRERESTDRQETRNKALEK